MPWVIILSALLGGAVGAILVFIRENRKEKRRLRDLAFQDWMDRVSAIARQHDFPIIADPENENIWFRRFVGGLTPEQAVRQAREARELARYPGIGDE